jgi:hypothetical protein
MAWDEALKAQAVKSYQDANPTPETSTEIIKEIAEEMEQSPNGVRMILVQAGVYVKKDPASGTSSKAKAEGEGTKRVSKETQINALTAAIQDAGADIDDEILSKLTGKAAAYFTDVITKVTKG